MAEIAAILGVVSGAMAKIAGDVTLLAQTEVGEASEGAAPGKGGSSAMPQKRNPVDATSAIAAARLAIGMVPVILSAMQQEHERAVGGWQAEWAAIPSLFCYTSSAVEHMRGVVSNLEIDDARMKTNLDASGGLIMSESLTMTLAQKVGRPEAFRIVQSIGKQISGSGKTLRQAALEDGEVRSVLSPEEIDAALDPARYLGSADVFIDRALATYARVRAV